MYAIRSYYELPFGRGEVLLAQQQFGGIADDVERVVDLMGDPGRHPSDLGEFFRADGLVEQELELGNVLDQDDGAGD